MLCTDSFVPEVNGGLLILNASIVKIFLYILFFIFLYFGNKQKKLIKLKNIKDTNRDTNTISILIAAIK